MYKTLRSSTITSLFLAIMLALAGSHPLAAQNGGEKMFKSPDFPVPFGPDNIGTEFYFSFPVNYDDITDGSLVKYVRIYISSGVETDVNIYIGNTYRTTVKTKPNEIVQTDLTIQDAQVFRRDITAPIPNDAVYPASAVHMVADQPIVVYGMNRTSYTSDGFLALPVNALGQTYVVATAANNVPIGGTTNISLPSQFMVITPYDNTSVTVQFPMATPNHAAGERETYLMQRGDVFSAMSLEFKGDMTGALVTANKPVAVTAGENCTYLPNENYQACDHIVEMLLPMESWGKVYYALPIQGRTKGDTYRVLAGEPNADVFVNGLKYATINQVGGEVGYGFIEYPAPDTRDPLIFTSNKRISVAQYNNGQNYDNSTSTDPFYMVLTPIEQFQRAVIFTTPGTDYPQNYINMIGDSLGMATAEMSKAGANNWTKIGNLNGSVPFTMPVAPDGTKYLGAIFPIPHGAYQIRSAGKFGAYIYGGGQYDSYGYPLSVATSNLIVPDKDAPLIIGEPDCAGNVDGFIRDLPEVDSIRSNLSSIGLSFTSINYTIDVAPYIPNVAPSVTYKLRVVDPTIDGVAYIIASDYAGNESYDTVRYFAKNISITPDPYDFGEVMINAGGVSQQVTITNNGQRTEQIVKLRVQNGAQGFVITAPATPFTLAPGESKQVTVQFTPTAKGSFADSLGYEDTCGVYWKSQVKAKVVKPVISVSDVPFTPPTPVGLYVESPTAKAMKITNVGDGTLLVSAGSPLTTTVFSLPNGLPVPPVLSLKAGESRTIAVGFRPDAVQTFRDSVIFSNNAPPDPANDSVGIITGEGIEATLIATSYDWGRKRVNTGWYLDTVYIENMGTADARVTGIKSKTPDLGDFRVDGEPTIQNVTLKPGQKIPVEVSFRPIAVGPREMTIVYNTDVSGPDVTSVLTGIGVLPGLKTEDLDFGTLNVGDPENMMTVDFTLDGTWPDGDWRDSVIISSFRFVSDNNGAGKDDFRYQLPAGTTFPIILKPNETEAITITGYFSPTLAGTRRASILAETLDGVDTISRWVGVGVSQNSGINVSASAEDQICIGMVDTIDVTISSNGQNTLFVSAVTVNDPKGEFTLLDPTLTNFTLAPGATKVVQVLFTPSAAYGNGPRSATVDVANNDPNNPVVTVNIGGSASTYSLTGQLDLSGTMPLDNGGTLAVLGENITARLNVNEPLFGAGIKAYRVIIDYDPEELLGPTSAAGIDANPVIHPAGTTVKIDNSSTRGHLVVDVTSPAPLAGTAGTLLTMNFGVVFTPTLNRSISAEVITTDGGACSSFDVEGSAIAVNPLCGLNLRLIELVPNGKFSLKGAVPNPTTGGMTDIEYSIGLDGPTTLQLFDANGTLVGTVVDSYQQPGTYRVAFDATTLSSGTYFCKLISGTHIEVKEINVSK